MPASASLVGWVEALPASVRLVLDPASLVADLDPDRARSAAERIPGCRALTTGELVAAADVDVVLNLTIPAAHAEVALAAIAQGKAVYGEKPLAATFAEAAAVMDAATAAGVRLGAAPDTVLGTGLQTARAAIDEGLIGRPTSASAMWVSASRRTGPPTLTSRSQSA